MVEILYYWKERIGTCRRQVLDNASQIPFQLLGGVPHDAYGMTSLSVRQYVLGIYKHLGLREKDITKVQTGGPGKFTFSGFCKIGRFMPFDIQMATLGPVSNSSRSFAGRS